MSNFITASKIGTTIILTAKEDITGTTTVIVKDGDVILDGGITVTVNSPCEITTEVTPSSTGNIAITTNSMDTTLNSLYVNETQIVLTPTAETGYVFDKWRIGENDYKANTSAAGISVNENGVLTYIVTEDKMIRALFKTIPTPASTSQSYVGYYAYVNGIEGIIYADLLAQTTRSGQWRTSNGTWDLSTSSTTSTDYKSYNVSGLTSEVSTIGDYTNTGVIELSDETEGLDRFLMMEISDRGNPVTWSSANSLNVNGWVLPSKEQWSIFGSAFGRNDKLNYLGLQYDYWSNTTIIMPSNGQLGAWYANSNNGGMGLNSVNETEKVRLCTSF